IDVWVRRGAEGTGQVPAHGVPGAGTFASTPTPDPSPSSRGRGIGSPDWDALRAEVAACRRCSLHATRTQTVFGVGNTEAEWMLIGEAPGVEEDRQGEPFVGRAGQLLNNMLAAMGMRREDVYICNILRCRPPKNRDPRPEEADACAPFLRQQIAWV